MPRTVTLVVVDGAGNALGALPPYPVAQPWWMATDDVVAGAKERFDLDVTVLRLLRAERPRHPGGHVHYAVQVNRLPTGLLDIDDELRALVETDDPLRAAYARPGGPQATLAWAATVLNDTGRGPVLATVQQRTWNLSSIWRLDTPSGTYWLKEVPPFFGHEAAVIGWLAAVGHGARAPELIAHDGRRLLMAHLPGVELYDADPAQRVAIAAQMHAIQVSADVDALLRLGVPDRRYVVARLTAVAAAHGDPADAKLRSLVAGLPDRLTQIEACGLPDTLVHGDLHGGNVIATPDGRHVILDWGDCVIGNPAIDVIRITDGLAPDDAHTVVQEWASWWLAAVPGCDPMRAIELMRPVCHLNGAAAYADFVANIERTEHPYHRSDVTDCLRAAAGLA